MPMKKPLEVVIDRARWLRGEGTENEGTKNVIGSCLLRTQDNKMCCLGFLALACGAQPQDISNVGTPDGTRGVNWPHGIVDDFANTAMTHQLMKINDTATLTDTQREARLKRRFAAMGIKVLFRGE